MGMSKIFPEDEPNRVGKLTEALRNTLEKLAEQENYTPEEMFQAAANATALYATAHGFNSLDVFEVQETLILEAAKNRKGQE